MSSVKCAGGKEKEFGLGPQAFLRRCYGHVGMFSIFCPKKDSVELKRESRQDFQCDGLAMASSQKEDLVTRHKETRRRRRR